MIKSALQSSLTNDIKYRSMSAGAVPSSEYLIETVVLGSSATSVTFSNLAQYAGVYKHLQIHMVARADNTQPTPVLRFNGDTNFNNYWMHALLGNGSSVSSAGVSSSDRQGMQLPSLFFAPGTPGANEFGALVIDILDPFSTAKNKTIRSLGGFATSNIHLWSGSWSNTSAINSITISKYAESGGYSTGSRFSLYGVV